MAKANKNDYRGKTSPKQVKNFEKQNSKNTNLSSQVKIDIEESYSQGSEATNFFEKFIANKVASYIAFALIIITSCLIVYQSSLESDIVWCDDNIFIYDFKDFNKDLANIPETFKKTFGTTYYRPMLNVSLILDYYFGDTATDNPKGGLNQYYYLRTNLILHITGSLFVLSFFILMGYDRLKSFVFAMIFAMHPLLTPSVAWISGRNDSMITLFILASFVTFIAYYQNKVMAQKVVLLILHLAFVFLAIFTKEVAIMIPPVIAIYIVWYKKEKLFTAQNIAAFAGAAAIFLVFLNFRHEATKNIVNPDTIGLEAFWANVPTIFALIGKIFLPMKMIALATFETFSIATGIIAMLGLIAMVWFFGENRKKRALFGVVWFVFFLFPSLMIRILYVDDFFDYAEHRAYLPMIGILLMILEILRTKKVSFYKPVPAILGLAIILSFANRSSVYKNAFTDRKAFWGHMVYVYPYVSRGYLDLGKAFMAEKRMDKAEALYLKGIELNPDNANLYVDLSVIYTDRKDFAKALSFSEKAYQLRPNDKFVNYYYGSALLLNGKHEDAVQPLVRAAKANNNADWFYRAGLASYLSQSYTLAAEGMAAAYRMTENKYNPAKFLGLTFTKTGQLPEAERFLKEALTYNQADPEASSKLIEVYLRTDRKAEAFNLANQNLANKVAILQDVAQMLISSGFTNRF